MFLWNISKQRWRKKVLSSLLQMSWHFSLSHFVVLLQMQKTVLHKKLTCLQQNSEDMHRAGSPEMFLGMDFHRIQASTDHRKVLSCCVDKPVRHGKKSFCIFSWLFFRPSGIPTAVCMQYDIQGSHSSSHEELPRTPKISVRFFFFWLVTILIVFSYILEHTLWNQPHYLYTYLNVILHIAHICSKKLT